LTAGEFKTLIFRLRTRRGAWGSHKVGERIDINELPRGRHVLLCRSADDLQAINDQALEGLELRSDSPRRVAAFIAASLLSDVPDFVPVSVSTDHFQRPRWIACMIRYSTPRCSMLGLPPRYD
jgi:hypothetical protein